MHIKVGSLPSCHGNPWILLEWSRKLSKPFISAVAIAELDPQATPDRRARLRNSLFALYSPSPESFSEGLSYLGLPRESTLASPLLASPPNLQSIQARPIIP